MTDALLLDTHVWIWFSSNSERISKKLLRQIDAAVESDTLYVAAYSLFEIMYAAQRNRIETDLTPRELLGSLLEDSGPRILPLTPAVALASTSLPASFHGDPGDRLIAATAIVHDLVLCTHDHHLLRFGRQSIFKYLEI